MREASTLLPSKSSIVWESSVTSCILAIVSESHDRYLAYVRLSKVTQRTIIELAAPRVEFVVAFYASVLRDTFLDTFYPLKNMQSILEVF